MAAPPRKALEQYAVSDRSFHVALFFLRCRKPVEAGILCWPQRAHALGAARSPKPLPPRPRHHAAVCVRISPLAPATAVSALFAACTQTDRVTPVLGKLIENIMAERPADPAQYIVRYLTNSDSMAASAAHWDALTAELAEAKKATPAAADDNERSIPENAYSGRTLFATLTMVRGGHLLNLGGGTRVWTHASNRGRAGAGALTLIKLLYTSMYHQA